MDRKAFAQKLALPGVCPFIIQNLSGSEPATESFIQDDKLQALQSQKQFVENWLSDLLESNAPAIRIRLFLKQPWVNRSGSRLLKASEGEVRPAILLSI
jgi:hypothetical protein